MTLAFFTHSACKYDMSKVNILKSILPFGIILQHMCTNGYPQLRTFGGIDAVIMWCFFAMSGYGLVISFINNEKYIDGFLTRAMCKLFIPYIIALFLFIMYYTYEGINQTDLFLEKGLWSFVPASWFIWTLGYFYVFFYAIFRNIKTNIVTKVFLLCIAIIAYRLIAPNIGVEYWRYDRCPGFCIGAIFALCDKLILTNVKKWHLILSIMGCLIIRLFFTDLHYPSIIILVFTALYLIKIPTIIAESKIVRFFSSISFELYIFQFIPIYIVSKDLNITNAPTAICFIFVMNIVLATVVHKFINLIKMTNLRQRKAK